MTGPASTEPVVSGTPYTVISVNGHLPTGLHDFLESAPVSMEIHLHGQLVVVRGTVRTGDNHSLMVYEKSDAGEGKDVRVWNVVRRDDHFEATQRPSS